MITAPYNFVPLNKEVFYPEWAEEVSHDVPFAHGESGEIDITITAKSPVFIRDHENPKQFCQHNGQYYIPATSVKGMVRNVLEIMSFGKLNSSFVDDNTYAVRDLRNSELYTSHFKPDMLFCGWLKQKGMHYVIENCGIPGRISHAEIDNLSSGFAEKFEAGTFKSNNENSKTAKYKYDLLKSVNLNQNFTFVKNDKGRQIYKLNGTKEGTLVMTGQASGRKNSGKFDAKYYEFIFFTPKEPKELEVSKKVMDNFKFAYFDGRKTQPKESPDWTYWKAKLEKNEKVPVFFQLTKGMLGEVAHFGLSYLYKLPYSHSIHQGIPESHMDTQWDLAQTLFGLADKEQALKGRVFFSHFKSNSVKPLAKRTENLGTPRASFYPFYVAQPYKEYMTYMDDNFELAGRKRYPIHKSNEPVKTKKNENEKIGTTFSPLPANTIFQGKLRYHNLKPEELGALLSALTFHDTPNTFHTLGMAKALGYGKVSVEVKTPKLKNSLEAFESMMLSHEPKWHTSAPIVELFTMATEQNNSGESELKYMELEGFAQVKRDKEYLANYSALNGIVKCSPKPLNPNVVKPLEVKQKSQGNTQKSSTNKSHQKPVEAKKTAADLSDFFKNR